MISEPSTLVWAASPAGALPPGGCARRALVSHDAVTIRAPSGLKADSTSLSWPRRTGR
jgi:hypothetical protein